MEFEDVYQEIEDAGALLKRYFEGDLTTKERQRLAAWLRTSRRNRELFCRIRDGRNLKACFERRQTMKPEEDFEELARRLKLFRRRSIFPISRIHYAVAAAACILFLGTGIWFMLHSPEKQKSVAVGPTGKVDAILTMADGTSVAIGKEGVNNLFGEEDPFVLKDSVHELAYKRGAAASKEIRYHQLEVPRGGWYKLKLEDGSMIWLNAESSVRFPEVFMDSLRMIEVSGEVFLKVAKDARRPFIVRAGEYRTEVLGTSFMMRVYPDEEGWSTTLVEGKVKVDYKHSSLLLAPGRKAYVEGNVLKEQEADIAQELAWMDGVYLFKHDRLEKVMQTLSRWYDVDFIFADEGLRDYEFTGSVYRDQSIDEVLELFEKMNVVSFVKGKDYILIKKRDKAN